MFSQFARKILFSGKWWNVFTTFITFAHSFSHFIRDFRECSRNSLVGKGILWLLSFYGLPPSRLEMLPPGNSRWRKMVKACSPVIFLLQVICTLLTNSWCPERFFRTKTISSRCLGEYKSCYVILIRWIHILVIISCVQTFYVLQNRPFFSFSPLVCLILVTVGCNLFVIMSWRWLSYLPFVWFLYLNPPDMC